MIHCHHILFLFKLKFDNIAVFHFTTQNYLVAFRAFKIFWLAFCLFATVWAYLLQLYWVNWKWWKLNVLWYQFREIYLWWCNFQAELGNCGRCVEFKDITPFGHSLTFASITVNTPLDDDTVCMFSSHKVNLITPVSSLIGTSLFSSVLPLDFNVVLVVGLFSMLMKPTTVTTSFSLHVFLRCLQC